MLKAINMGLRMLEARNIGKKCQEQGILGQRML